MITNLYYHIMSVGDMDMDIVDDKPFKRRKYTAVYYRAKATKSMIVVVDSIKNIMKINGITQNDIANESGINFRGVSRFFSLNTGIGAWKRMGILIIEAINNILYKWNAAVDKLNNVDHITNEYVVSTFGGTINPYNEDLPVIRLDIRGVNRGIYATVYGDNVGKSGCEFLDNLLNC